MVALASPLLNYVFTGMPVVAMLPVVLIKSLTLALVASFMGAKLRTINPLGIVTSIGAMVSVGLLIDFLTQVPLTQSFKMIQLSLPGLGIMLMGGYLILRLLNKKGKAK